MAPLVKPDALSFRQKYRSRPCSCSVAHCWWAHYDCVREAADSQLTTYVYSETQHTAKRPPPLFDTTPKRSAVRKQSHPRTLLHSGDPTVAPALRLGSGSSAGSCIGRTNHISPIIPPRSYLPDHTSPIEPTVEVTRGGAAVLPRPARRGGGTRPSSHHDVAGTPESGSTRSRVGPG